MEILKESFGVRLISKPVDNEWDSYNNEDKEKDFVGVKGYLFTLNPNYEGMKYQIKEHICFIVCVLKNHKNNGCLDVYLDNLEEIERDLQDYLEKDSIICFDDGDGILFRDAFNGRDYTFEEMGSEYLMAYGFAKNQIYKIYEDIVDSKKIEFESNYQHK